MKAFGKILGLFVLGLLLIIVAAGFALTHFFDPNDYKDEIRQLARNKAHVELDLKGDIGWSLFPWLGLELHDASVATLTNPKAPFADLQMLGLSVRVLPLLRREVQMSDVRVEGLNLTLNRDANGHGNWEDIGKPAPSPAGTEPTAPTSTSGGTASEGTARPLKLDIDSLTVNNATVRYVDEQTGRQYSAESIQLSTGAVHDNADIPIKFTAFLGTNLPQIRARTEVAGDLRFDRALQRYQFGDFKLSGEASGDPMQGKTLTFGAQGQLLLDKAANVAEWTGLKLSANQLRALGELHVRDLSGNPQLSGGLSIAQFNLRTFLDSVGVVLPAMADANSLNSVELVTRLAGSKTALALDDLNLQVDGSTYTGRLAVDDFAKQSLRVQLKGDKVDADRYLPPKSQNSASVSAARQSEVDGSEAAITGSSDSPLPDAPTKGAWSDERLLPVERLRSLDVQADLSFGQLTLDKLPITDATFKAQAQDGLLTLQTLGGGLFNGSFETHGTLDARPEVPALAVQTKVNRVPVEQFIKTQSPKATITGLLTLDSNLTSTGNSQKALIDGLNGNARFAISNGVLVNANLEQQVCRGISTLNRKTLNGEPRSRDTPFRQLGGSLVIRNGVASNQDLKVAIPGLSVSGNGTVDLRVLGMDYRVGVLLEGDTSVNPDPACQVNQNFANLEFPLLCRGPLELGAKACRVDREGLAKVAAKAAGDRIGDKIEEKLGDKVTPELKDALRGLFKR